VKSIRHLLNTAIRENRERAKTIPERLLHENQPDFLPKDELIKVLNQKSVRYFHT
jgi:hypothetical protein